MTIVEGALSGLGVDIGAVEQVAAVIGQFGSQNVTIDSVLNAAQTIGNLITGGPRAVGIGVPAQSFGGASGEWESTRYAYDLNRHHPKLKFLFKVGFVGFTPEVRDFYFFVHRMDKPKIKLLHQDVNYYNFRTRVLTGVVFEPLTIEFLDEIGDTVNQFFVEYMKTRSGTGGGNFGINEGFGESTSSRPYEGLNPGYGAGKYILLEQIFANGTKTNQFRFMNPRIESFDFNELTMEETAGSMMTLQFSYDAIQCATVGEFENPTWGDTDLLRGGGTSGPSNGGASSLGESGNYAVGSASGLGIGSASNNNQVYQGGLLSTLPNSTQLPATISAIVGAGVNQLSGFNQSGVVSSATDTLSSNIQDTLHSIVSGDNLQFNGAASGAFNDRRFSGEVLTDAKAVNIASQIFPG